MLELSKVQETREAAPGVGLQINKAH
jgi:hypothetical protein